MYLNPAQHHRYALDRQQRLLAEATAHRLTDREPARTRIARLLRRAADRPSTANAPCGPVGTALTQRS
jgi:hypothetical protein